MKNIKLDSLTIYFLFICFMCGFIKHVLIIFMIVFIHELGHVFITKICGYKIKKITIYPFGGVTIIDKDLNTPLKKEFLISLGGFLGQLLIYLITKLNIFNILTTELILKYNYIIFIFNLIPIIPLDGSVIVNTILNKFFSFRISYKITFFILLINIIFFMSYNYIYSLNNYLIMVFLFYKMYCYVLEQNYIYNRFLLERYLNNYEFKNWKTKKGDLRILKKDTYHYLVVDDQLIEEKMLLKNRFDK